MQAGLATVFQEFNLLPERTVAQNVFLGREPRRGGFVDREGMVARDGGAARRARHRRSSTRPLGCGSSRVAEQQIVEIVKALSFDARVISMDEPTAALADHEVELLYAIIRRLHARGVAILYVSHRLKEIFDLCDRITVLKDGALVSTARPPSSTPDELVRRMVGRPISDVLPRRRRGHRARRRCASSSRTPATSTSTDVDLELRAGEIVGRRRAAGLRPHRARRGASSASTPFTRGEMRLDGTPVRSPLRPRRP